MIKLAKYLKPFTIGILAVIALLFVQAVADLALPDYMSKIVDTGINQNGIEGPTPEYIRESEYEKLQLFMTPEEQEVVDNAYTLVTPDDATEDQQDIVTSLQEDSSESVYFLDEAIEEEELNELNKIFTYSISTYMGMLEAGKNGAQVQNLALATPEQLAEIIDTTRTELDTYPPNALAQGAVEYIKVEYDALGINMVKYQNQYLIQIGGIMLVITFISGVCAITVSFISARVGAGFARNLRRKTFKKIESFSNVEFDKFSTASLITRTTNDITQIQMVLIMVMRIVFYSPLIALGGVYKVAQTDSSLSWVTAFAIGAVIAMILIIFVIVLPKFKVIQKLVDKLNLVSRESLTGLLVVRAFNTQKHEEDKFDMTNEELTRVNVFVNRVTQFMWPAMMLIMNVSSLLIIWFGALEVDAGTMMVGDMMAYMQYTIQIIFAFMMVSFTFIMIPRASVSAKRVAEVLETEPAIQDPKQPKKFGEEKNGEVVFKNVSFKYPGAEDYALENINFTAHNGQITAFIGSTGAGKTTLINLIPRFYDVTEGSITVDGIDVREVTQHDLRERIGYVPQKAMLFSGSIESNLTFAKEDATAADMNKATEIAQATNFIESKEEGMQTHIAQGGANVSGGQKQRLSIARAVIKDSEVFIFDDSFSALDFKTDAALRRSLGENMSDATLLIVAQRVSTIINADQIIVLDEGKVVGKGTHKELLKTCSVYKDIADSQLTKEELENE